MSEAPLSASKGLPSVLSLSKARAPTRGWSGCRTARYRSKQAIYLTIIEKCKDGVRARQRITSSILCPTYERAQKVDMLFIDVPISGPSGK